MVVDGLSSDPTQAFLKTSFTPVPEQKSMGVIVGMHSSDLDLDPSTLSGYVRCKLSGECKSIYWVNPQSLLFADVSSDSEAFIATLYDPVNQIHDLFLLSTSGGKWQRLTNTPETEYLRDWSSTNQKILYITFEHTADPSQPPIGTLFAMELANNQ